jgi:hypothetical protein
MLTEGIVVVPASLIGPSVAFLAENDWRMRPFFAPTSTSEDSHR